MKIRELLLKRIQYSICKFTDDWVDEVAYYCEDSETWLISIADLFTSPFFADKSNSILEKYNIVGIYGLGKIYGGLEKEFSLFHLKKNVCNEIKMSVLREAVYDKKILKSISLFEGPSINSTRNYIELYEWKQEKYNDNYCSYLDCLEHWINTGRVEENFVLSKNEFFIVNATQVVERRYYPKYYCKEAVKIRNLLKSENVVKLGDVADSLRVRPMDETVIGHAIGQADLKYPFEVDKITAKSDKMILIKKKDIIICDDMDAFFVPDDVPDNYLYADRGMIVVRCKKIQPEYLFLYLNSEVGKCVIETEIAGVGLRDIQSKGVEEIPIVLPSDSLQKYEDAVQTIIHKERIYAEPSNQCETEDSVLDIFDNEIINKIKVYKKEQLQDLLENDIRELNTCFKARAYKATLILAGSILEAILIDWISEIKGRDYFKEEYMVETQNYRGERIKKRADLIDYINEIKSIERPHWMKEADKAHTIRKQRNLVHAKLCLNSDIEINEKTCKMVVGFLGDIIKTRENKYK